MCAGEIVNVIRHFERVDTEKLLRQSLTSKNKGLFNRAKGLSYYSQSTYVSLYSSHVSHVLGATSTRQYTKITGSQKNTFFFN